MAKIGRSSIKTINARKIRLVLEINSSWFDGFDQLTEVFSTSFKLQIFAISINFGEYYHGRCFVIYLFLDILRWYLLFFSILLVSRQTPDTQVISGQ